MCGSMADIQSATAEIRRGKKEEKRKKEERRKKKPQDKNIMVCRIPQGNHNNMINNILLTYQPLPKINLHCPNWSDDKIQIHLNTV